MKQLEIIELNLGKLVINKDSFKKGIYVSLNSVWVYIYDNIKKRVLKNNKTPNMR